MRFLSDDLVIDTSDPNRRVEVLAIGLPRCATSSLQAALESEWLGYGPCMHMAHTVPWPERSQMVIDALYEPDREKRHKILYKLFAGFASQSDLPGIAFTDDLMDMFPDAKIILNQRQDAHAFAKSVEGSIAFFHTWPYILSTILLKSDRLHWKIHFGVYKMFNQKLGTGIWDYDTLVDLYGKYNNWIKEEAKKRNRPVLEWQPHEGWEPICKFLGKPVPPPEVPFPHINDHKEMQRLKVIVVARGLLAWAGLGVAVYAGVKYGPKYWFR
ncbi:hypothetical protein F4818DRAFT_380566 [Hypoxylon cercidicola]|nr:hypothetical protein F4818DRAFT_380566 [Hypoxylon cercidicola]